jgi:hypothetical protein
MWDALTGFLQGALLNWKGILWSVGLFLVLFVGSLVLVSFLLVKLPATYFLSTRDPELWVDRHPVLRWTGIILKNLLGIVLVVLGVVQLVTPGQGVITILIGLMLVDYPGKRRFERWLVSRPGVSRFINRLRARYGKPPLVFEEMPEKKPAQGREVDASCGKKSRADLTDVG